MQSHDLKVGTAHHSRAYLARFTQAHHREADRGEVSKRADGLYAGFQVLDFRHGEPRVFELQSRRTLPDVDQPVLIAIDQRAQQNSPDEAENRSIGSDSQGQSKDDGDRKALTSP